MLAYHIKCKPEFNYFDGSLDRAFDIVQINEPHEVGEIINGYWLIVNSDATYQYNSGQYVKVINLKYFDLVATDINHDSTGYLVKLGTEKQLHCNKEITVNIYKVLI